MKLSKALAVAALFAGASLAQPSSAAGSRELVYVQATMTKDLYVIDATSFQTVSHIPIGDYTYDVVGSPDGKIAYVDAQVPSGNPITWQANEAGKVVAIDTASDKILWTTYVDGSVQHLVVDPDGARVYVPMFDRNYIYVLDGKSGQIVQRWYSTLGNHGVALTRDGKRLYVGNMLNDNICVYDTASGRVRLGFRNCHIRRSSSSSARSRGRDGSPRATTTIR